MFDCGRKSSLVLLNQQYKTNCTLNVSSRISPSHWFHEDKNNDFHIINSVLDITVEFLEPHMQTTSTAV
jgi:hypothetical protein